VRTRVSKAIIHIVDESGSHYQLRYLMSSKRKPGHRDHSRLEFLGGRHEPGEDAKAALLRELGEEETTGRLCALAENSLSQCVEIIHDETHHYLYRFSVAESACGQLMPDPAESLGFSLVPGMNLIPGQAFTNRTNQILTCLLKSDPGQLLL
jgi:hypothetical protein